MKCQFILHDKNIVHVTSNQPPIPCFKPRKTWRLPMNHRLLHFELDFPSFAWLWIFLTEFALICRGLFRYCVARGKFLPLKDIVTVLLSCFTHKYIDCIHERGSTQANYLLVVIFESFENYLGQNWEYLEQNWIFFEQIWLFCFVKLNTRTTEWRWGILYWTIQASRWHAFYLFSGQVIPRMLQGEILVFYCTVVSLRGHIFPSIKKFGSHVWNVANESLVAYTDLLVSLVHSWFNSTREWHGDKPRSRCCW